MVVRSLSLQDLRSLSWHHLPSPQEPGFSKQSGLSGAALQQPLPPPQSSQTSKGRTPQALGCLKQSSSQVATAAHSATSAARPRIEDMTAGWLPPLELEDARESANENAAQDGGIISFNEGDD